VPIVAVPARTAFANPNFEFLEPEAVINSSRWLTSAHSLLAGRIPVKIKCFQWENYFGAKVVSH